VLADFGAPGEPAGVSSSVLTLDPSGKLSRPGTLPASRSVVSGSSPTPPPDGCGGVGGAASVGAGAVGDEPGPAPDG
jgi:hypothetical protein